MNARRHGATWIAVSLALAFAAGCGEEKTTRHGLESAPLSSKPQGESVTVRHAFEDGERYAARITLRSRYAQQRTGGTGPESRSGSGSAVLALRQATGRTAEGGPLRSTIELRYVEAEGKRAQAFLARAPITGTFDHTASGYPRHDTLRVTGGTPEEQGEALDLLGTLLFAGFAGSPTWLPPHPVRVGEAWALEGFLRPRALESVARQARLAGLQSPTPRFSGTARLEALRASPQGSLLEVALDALIEIDGAFSRDGGRGRMSVGDRVTGTATISARTGLPLAFRVKHERRTDVRTGDEHVEQTYVEEVEGAVTADGAPADGR